MAGESEMKYLLFENKLYAFDNNIFEEIVALDKPQAAFFLFRNNTAIIGNDKHLEDVSIFIPSDFNIARYAHLAVDSQIVVSLDEIKQKYQPLGLIPQSWTVKTHSRLIQLPFWLPLIAVRSNDTEQVLALLKFAGVVIWPQALMDSLFNCFMGQPWNKNIDNYITFMKVKNTPYMVFDNKLAAPMRKITWLNEVKRLCGR